MNQFLFKKDGDELLSFPHIIEFALKKNITIQFNSLKPSATESLRFYYILEGKFEWVIDEKRCTLYPGDLAVILPGQLMGGEKNFLDVGTLAWLHIEAGLFSSGRLNLGKWSRLPKNECRAIGKILAMNTLPVLSAVKEAGAIFQKLYQELVNGEIGATTRVSQLIDESLILVTRKLTHQNNSRRDFPQTIVKLEQNLRENLAHQWTVEEMAALAGLGTTAFSEKVKSHTGFSPLNYLINIRISEALKLLKRPDVQVTSIALDVGFYSSQHFATTFKKLTGYTPSEFRKQNLSHN